MAVLESLIATLLGSISNPANAIFGDSFTEVGKKVASEALKKEIGRQLAEGVSADPQFFKKITKRLGFSFNKFVSVKVGEAIDYWTEHIEEIKKEEGVLQRLKGVIGKVDAYTRLMYEIVADKLSKKQLLELSKRILDAAKSLKKESEKNARIKAIIREEVTKNIDIKDEMFLDEGTLVDESEASQMIRDILAADKKGRYLSSNELFSLIGSSLSTAGNFILQNSGLFGYSTPCVMGVIPLRHVNNLEVAFSGKILKYRATGSVFLAQQHGGRDAVRVDGYIYEEEAILWILFIWLMFLHGRGRTMSYNQSRGQFELEGLMGKFMTIIGVGGIAGNIATLGGLISARKLTNLFNYDEDLQKPSWEHHYTFPFVTRHVIVPNCYIETFSFEDRVVDGLNVIKYSLLLRTYNKPDKIDLFSVGKGSQRWMGTSGKGSKTIRWLSVAVNFVWRLLMSQGIVIKEGEYMKNTDYFYNIDPIDIFTTLSVGILAKAGLHYL